MQIVFYVAMFIIGACFGSFLCCQARRLRLKETGKKSLGPRSVCPACKHQLKWYENLPIISWVLQGGKCRKCKKKIGTAEILSELLTALAFLGLTISFFQTPASLLTTTIINWAIFITTLLLTLSLTFLAIYDGLYGELPSLWLIISIICATVVAALKLSVVFTTSSFSWQPFLDLLFSVLILGGLYLILYLVSKGKWVGDGDWLLGVAIAIALGAPWLALIALFIANFSACLVMFPAARKKKSRAIYFGPFLVFAFILTLILANYGIINL